MKRVLACLCALAMTFAALAMPADAVGYDPSATYTVQAQCAYIVNTDTNVILYEKNSEQQMAAGGLTKLMTAALILTNYQDALDSTNITMTSAVSDYVYNTPYADVRPGETFTLRQMLYAMLLPNGNDAAMGTAYALSGNDLAGFTSQMNALSARIGTTASVWTDACGIDAGNLTTAKDMYLILRYLMGFDSFTEIAGTYLYQMPANVKHASSFNLFNTNKILSQAQGGQYYRSAMKGGKTDVSGYTDANTGTQSLVSWASQNGETYIFSILGSPDNCDTYGYSTRRPALYETDQLIDWVFSNFSIQSALDTTQPLCEIPVRYSSQTDSLLLYPADDLKTILPATADSTVTQKVYNLPDEVYAPVKQGDVVGTVSLVLAGTEIGTVDLVAGQDVSRNDFLYALAQLEAFFTGTYFKVVLVLSLLCIAGYLAWFAYQNHLRRKNNIVRRD